MLISVFILYILYKKDPDNIIALFEFTKDDIELLFTDNYKRYYYFILADLIVSYKEQVFITDIKSNILYSIYHILIKRKELVIWF